MDEAYQVKQGDHGETLRVRLLDRNDDPVNLTGATVRFLVRASNADEAKIDAEATPDADQTENTGYVDYTFTEDDLDTQGIYRAEWEVTYSGGAVETFPTPGFDHINVGPDLG